MLDWPAVRHSATVVASRTVFTHCWTLWQSRWMAARSFGRVGRQSASRRRAGLSGRQHRHRLVVSAMTTHLLMTLAVGPSRRTRRLSPSPFPGVSDILRSLQSYGKSRTMWDSPVTDQATVVVASLREPSPGQGMLHFRRLCSIPGNPRVGEST